MWNDANQNQVIDDGECTTPTVPTCPDEGDVWNDANQNQVIDDGECTTPTVPNPNPTPTPTPTPEPATGGFSVDKVIGSGTVPEGNPAYDFTVDCTKDGQLLDINGDEDGTQAVLTLHADDALATIDGIADGATCTINETEAHNGTPSITVDGAASNLGNFDIVGDATRAIVVTNDFPEVEARSRRTRPPRRLPTRPCSTARSRTLPRTGDESGKMATVGLGLLMFGIVLTMGSRRRLRTLS